ncbi:LuxR family transcriptional regulator [Deinococcus marmoris]|uniref:LuxR family transcriptional regulator n=1 Tax=Deinococcus marmoris TaxID=249408 RepID=UPI001C3763FA|nr:LuxR family transcriptional regulator [Deinococcus marmoris]
MVRSDLLEQLAVTGQPCVAVIAPSGYGKTTLLAQYARSTARSVAWLTLAESDVETGQLFQALLRALHAFPELQFTVDDIQTPYEFTTRLLERLADMQGSLDLILDRVERVTRLQGAWLGQLVEGLPDRHRLILAGYDLNGFPLARLVAAGKLHMLTHTQLRFTLEDTQAFMQLRDAAQDPATVHGAVEGWPVGVALACADETTHVELGDLLQDVLDRLPSEVRRALPELALIEEWSESTGSEVGLALPDHWLRTLRQAGLPLTPLGRGLYRPHTLLVDTLATELKRDPLRAAPIHQRLAQQAAQQGNLTEAVRHAAAATDIALLEDSAGILFPRLRSRHEFVLLAELTAVHPAAPPGWWQEYQAVAQIETGQVNEGEALLQNLERAASLGPLGYAALSLQAARRGDFERQLQSADAGLALPESPVHSVLMTQRASALISLQRPQEGLAVCQQMAASAQQRGAVLEEGNALHMQQYALMMLGRWEEQEWALTRARALFVASGRHSSVLQIDQQLIGIHLLYGRIDEAETLLQEAIPVAARNQLVLLPTLLLSKAHLLLARGEFSDAAEAIDTAQAQLQALNLPVLLPFVHFERFDLYSAAGQRELAQEAFELGVTTSTTALLKNLYVPFYQGLQAFDQQDWPRARLALDQAAQHGAEHSHQLRAAALLAAIDHATGATETLHLAAAREFFSTFDAAVTCSADRHRLNPLVSALRGTLPDHPLARLEPVFNTPVASGFRLLVDTQVRLTLAGQDIKLPLSNQLCGSVVPRGIMRWERILWVCRPHSPRRLTSSHTFSFALMTSSAQFPAIPWRSST